MTTLATTSNLSPKDMDVDWQNRKHKEQMEPPTATAAEQLPPTGTIATAAAT
jgi:hypothetical protein